MTYKEFPLEKMAKRDYYKSIVLFKDYIIEDIDNKGQAAVAKKLGMSQSKLSNILHILKVL